MKRVRLVIVFLFLLSIVAPATVNAYSGTQMVTTIDQLEVVATQDISVKDSTIATGSTWTPKDNFNQITLTTGVNLTWKDVEKDIKVDGKVDTSIPGTYKVTYTYQDKSATSTIVVKDTEVIKIQEITVKDSTIATGSKWTAKDNFKNITLTSGINLTWKDVEKDIKTEGKVDTNIPGTYKVKYTYQDKSATSTIVVKDMEVIKIQEISVKDSTIATGSKWTAEDNFNHVMLTSGINLTWKDVEKDIKVDGKVDTNIPGTYKVTYTYQDKSATATIIVKDMEVIKVQEVAVKDSTIPTGSKWEAKDNFNHVMLTSGINLTWKDVEKDIKVDGNVDTNIPGTYKVTYTYQDISSTATIIVKDMEVIKVQQVSVKDSTITTGSKWEAKDNFNHVMLTSGVNLAWKDVEKDIKVEGKVDTNVPGSYKVTYTYQDKSAVATITVANKSTDKGKTTPPKKLLPQTGESISGSMVAIGFIIVVGVFLIVASKLKKKEP